MIRFLLIISLLVNLSYANAEKYFIQFGSFRDLDGLERSIARLPNTLRSHVIIIRSDSWYIPFAYYTSNRNILNSKLTAYKRYFKDAHINHFKNMLSYPLVRNYGRGKRVISSQRVYTPSKKRVTPRKYQNVGISEEDNTLKLQSSLRRREKIITQKVVINNSEDNDIFSNVKPKKYKNFSKQMLSGQHYYLAYKKTAANPTLLIKVTFENHQVTYQPIIGEMKMTKANYVTKNGRLYMFVDTFTKNSAYSKLEENREDYFLVSSWAGGKKLDTLRYYYKMNDAKKYLGLKISNGLAEVLSEGDYDDYFLDDE